MVHTLPPAHRQRLNALVHGSTTALHVGGVSRRFMKNFARLVQFAWRYKVRFGMSVGCAFMVALLFFTELGAVYPLLHILFGSQNPQRWISQKIGGLDNDITVLRAQETEAQHVRDELVSGRPHLDELKERLGRANDTFDKKQYELRERERGLGIGIGELRADIDQSVGGKDNVLLDRLKHDRRIAEARLKELQRLTGSIPQGGCDRAGDPPS